MKSWRVSAVSVRGTSHIKSDLPCQDAFEWRNPSPGLLLAAVADGAGSASESLAGARAACRGAVEFLEQQAKPLEALEESFRVAREAVLAEAERLKLPPRELACTLIVVAALADGIAAAQIGDGASLIERAGGGLEAASSPPDSEYLNETVFLTGDEALSAVAVETIHGPIESVAMFTDGLQMLALKMPGAAPHAPFFAPLFRFMRQEPNAQVRLDQLEKFLRSPKITQRADDDLTLLLAAFV